MAIPRQLSRTADAPPASPRGKLKAKVDDDRDDDQGQHLKNFMSTRSQFTPEDSEERCDQVQPTRNFEVFIIVRNLIAFRDLGLHVKTGAF